MDYYVVYDEFDNIVCYLANKFEMCNFTGIRLGDVGYKFKNNKCVVFELSNKKYKVFRFC